ncbi:MAG TPA: hypothetical protein VM509_00100 [Planctomycetota bacterium]|nr:hypothetical protein [Planctomycetota bacterium]
MQRRRSDPGFSLLAALVCAAGSATCAREPEAASRIDLRRTLEGAARCHVSVPDEATAKLAREAIGRRASARLAYEVSVGAPSVEDFGSDPRIWIGNAAFPGAEEALARLGVGGDEHGFRFEGQDFAGPRDGLIATVPDPERHAAILEVVLANDPAALLACVRDWTPTARLGLQLFQGGRVRAERAVDATGAVGAGGSVDVALVTSKLAREDQRGERVDFDWTATEAYDAESDAEWLASLDAAAKCVRERLGSITPFDAPGRLAVRILPTPEDLARSCRARGDAHTRTLELAEELTLVHVAGSPDNGAFELARALALANAGAPRARWLADGLAAASAKSWFARPSASWLAHLWTGELVPGVEQLVRDDGALSPHVTGPLRGALLEACEELHGPGFAARAWHVEPQEQELPSDEAFRAFLTRTIGSELENARTTRVQRREASIARSERRGACLLPAISETDPFAGGFGSADCDASLQQLQKLGASAVALCWCAALEPSEPRFFGAGPAAWTQADDAALYFTISSARRANLAVTLAPQLVAAENGGWAGQVMLTTRRSRRALFAAWRASSTHVGLLAELAGADVLSLGSDAPDTAVTRQGERNRRSVEDLDALRTDWSFLIAAARGAFSGGLTYAARWDGEAQGIEFWKELDFVGQNVFVPFGEAPRTGSPTANEYAQRIVAAFAHLAQLGEQNGVRGLVMSIGVSSTADGWREPSQPSGEIDLGVQAHFYQGLMKAQQLGARQQFTPAGIFTWCWWTDPARGGAHDRGFTPQNKPAQAALGRALQVR